MNKAVEEYVGGVIVSARHNKEEDRIEIDFESGDKIIIFDSECLCCEERYITCDDDLSELEGGKLIDIVTKLAPTTIDDNPDNVHEQAFTEIKTDKGFVTFTTHNVHNGNYSGFVLTVRDANPPSMGNTSLQM